MGVGDEICLLYYGDCTIVVVGGFDRLCGCFPCLKYPQKGNTPRVNYIIIYYLVLRLAQYLLKDNKNHVNQKFNQSIENYSKL